ncbi:MAG: hypothetical protein KDA85_01740, partial [Planctomycetaceae bacterium]|nr:hypothetical protein [Planctomycetaceae bacterium]
PCFWRAVGGNPTGTLSPIPESTGFPRLNYCAAVVSRTTLVDNPRSTIGKRLVIRTGQRVGRV